MEIVCLHMFIYTDFEIIHMFSKERRSKYKQTHALVLTVQFSFFRAASERTVTEKFGWP